MTRIDFHSNVPDKISYTCRLARKATAANCKVAVLAEDHHQMLMLDEALWTFSELDFLPHVIAGSRLEASTPIILCDSDTPELPHYQILINLSLNTPAHFARFDRMFEVISVDEADRQAGRERYRFYKERGYPLTHFIADSP